MSMAVPGFIGVVLGVFVLVVGFIWRSMSPGNHPNIH